MSRFKLFFILALFLSSCPMVSDLFASPQDKPFTIYMAVWRGCEEACEGFQDYFKEEGIDVDIVIRNANRDKSKLPAFVREAKSIKADLVITWGTSVTVGMIGTLKNSNPVDHITDIPVVFMIVADPIGAGIVDNYQSSGRSNITGTRNRVPEEIQMKAIRAYRYFDRLGIIYNTDELNSVLNVEKIRKLSQRMDFDLVEKNIDLNEKGEPIIESVPEKIKELKDHGVTFIYIGSSSFLMRNKDLVTESAIEQGVPIVSPYASMARKSNALLAVASKYYSVGKLAGRQAKKILVDHTPPIELPIKNLSRYSYLVNMETARRLSLQPPEMVMRYAELIHDIPPPITSTKSN